MSDTYDPEREEVVGDAAFDREDHRNNGTVAFDIDEGQFTVSQAEGHELPADLFLLDPSRKEGQ